MTQDVTRYVVYARQSLTRNDEDSLSIEMQVKACKEFVAARGGTVVGIYEEPNTKGWRTDRPQFLAMLDMLRNGNADIVVVFKLSRFARNLMHQETVLNEIAAAGGELVSVTEPHMNASPMVRQILGAVNEQYRRDQSDFLRASFESRARRGRHHGYAPIGYTQDDDGVLVIDDDAAETVRLIFQWALEGHGGPEITYRLNEQRRPTARGEAWNVRSVMRLLKNRVYAGDVVFRGDVVAHDAHPAIVSPDEFDRVQTILQSRQHVRRKASPSWADGFVYHACGSRMYVAQWSAGDDVRWRFRCGANYGARKDRSEPGCDIAQKSMFQERVEETFLDLLIDALAHVATPAEARRRIEAREAVSAQERQKARARLERRLSDLQRQRDKLLDLVLAGRVDDEMYAMRDATMKLEMESVRAELDAVPATVSDDALSDLYSDLVAVSDAFPIVAKTAPHKLPETLHTIDVRLVVTPDEPHLVFGPMTGAFLS